MSNNLWLDVPAGAELILHVTGKTTSDKGFLGGARYVPDVGESEIWDITHGPISRTLPGPGGSSVRVGLRFTQTKKRTAVVTATLKSPNGTSHADAQGRDTFSFELSGKKGDGMQRGTMLFWPEQRT